MSQRGLASQSDLQKLLNEANLSHDELATLNNLAKMGCPLVQEGKGNGKFARLREKRVSSFGGGEAENESEYS